MYKDAAGNKSYEGAFTYTYDAVGRYRASGYEERTSAATTSFAAGHGWDEAITGYDANGNITGLMRNTSTQGSGTPVPIDNLTYTYDPNIADKLNNIPDGTDSGNTGAGFMNLAASTVSYTYDANGNLPSYPRQLHIMCLTVQVKYLLHPWTALSPGLK